MDSESIESVGYDARTRTLEIEFHNHAVYQYFDVPPGMHARLMVAESKGTFVNRTFKKAGYRYQRVTAPATR